MVTVLVTAGADGKMVDGDGKTPLHKVCLQVANFHGFHLGHYLFLECLSYNCFPLFPLLPLDFLPPPLPPQACEGGHVHVASQLLDLFPATAAVRDSKCRLPQDLVSNSNGQWSQLWGTG